MPQKSYIYQKKWKKQWKEYKKKLPHWAVDAEPSKLARSLLKLLKKHEIKKGKILEIGCGNGRDSLFFACSGFNITGIDVAPEAISLCNKKRADSVKKQITIKSKIKFLVADAENLPFEDKSFVAAYSIAVLHSTDLEKSLKELARVIKKNGLALIHVYEKTIFLPSNKIKKIFSPEKIKNILAKLPFHILEFKSGVTTKKIDYDEELGEHKHFSIIMSLRRL